MSIPVTGSSEPTGRTSDRSEGGDPSEYAGDLDASIGGSAGQRKEVQRRRSQPLTLKAGSSKLGVDIARVYLPGNVVPRLITVINPFMVRQWPGKVQTYG